MKKILLIVITVMLLVTGCSNSAYQAYGNAIERTRNVSSGKMKITQEINIDFDTEGLDAKEIAEFNKWKQFKADILFTFDKEEEESVMDIYAQFYDLGIEGKLYNKKDSLYIVSPLFSKILVLKEDDLKGGEIVKLEEQFPIYDFKDIQQMWKDTINNEDVSKLGNIIITTPEGDIKSKEFHINLTKEDLTPLIIEGTKILNKFIIKQMENEDENGDEDVLIATKIIEDELNNLAKDIDFEKIHHKAYIDRDGFIVEEETHMLLKFPSTEEGYIKSLEFKLNIQNWDLNKNVKITMPGLTNENTMKIDELIDSDFVEKFKGGI